MLFEKKRVWGFEAEVEKIRGLRSRDNSNGVTRLEELLEGAFCRSKWCDRGRGCVVRGGRLE